MFFRLRKEGEHLADKFQQLYRIQLGNRKKKAFTAAFSVR
jgi:hypothetical protein